jgi:hypothetical protein
VAAEVPQAMVEPLVVEAIVHQNNMMIELLAPIVVGNSMMLQPRDIYPIAKIRLKNNL